MKPPKKKAGVYDSRRNHRCKSDLDFVRSRGHELKPAGQNFVTNGCPVTQHKRGHRPVIIYPETQVVGMP